ncbi:hypothetical protein [Streptomyces sp. NPDC046261]|uniref:hypothetical protein n=1 Tax=Streptomyces sp. NPDC046261 TaxID=3157200 RepID=UPI0033C3BEC0
MAVDPGPLIPDSIGNKFEDTKEEHSRYNKKINDLSFVVNKQALTMNGMSASINQLSLGLDTVKLGLGLVALGFTPVKIDGGIFKMDEKGISILGVQHRTWPWTREGGSFWRVVTSKKDLDKYDEKKAREAAQERLDSRLRTEIRDIKRRLGAADNNAKQAYREVVRTNRTLTGHAQETKRAHRRIDSLESRLRAQRKQVGKVAAQPNVSDGNPRRLKGAADQIKALEARVNSLMAALG